MSDESNDGAGETAKAAGRGGIAIAGAKVAFIVFGFAQQILLTRLLGSDGYGQLRIVLLLVSMVNNTVVAMSIQGVSRAVSRAVDHEPEAYRAALRIHLVVAVVVAAGFAASAGWLADLECAPHLAGPLRLVSLVVLLYGLYAPVVGSLNGRRRFLDQAGLDTAYTMLRTAGLVLGAIAWKRSGESGVMGSFAGFVAAAAIILPVALLRAGTGKAGEGGQSTGTYLSFLVPVAGGQILLNLLMSSDIFLLRRFLGSVDARCLADTAAARIDTTADTFAGIYAGAQTFAFLPYQFLMSVTFILFPMLARAQVQGDTEAVRSFTMAGVRLAMILTALITGTVSGLAPWVLRLAYPETMWPGGEALRILCLGMGAFSILGITCSALTSLGRAKDAAALTGVGVALIAGGCSLFVPGVERGLPMLRATATVTSVALLITATIGAVRLRAVAGGFVKIATIVRVLVALTVTVLVGSRMPWIGKIGTLAEGALMVAIGLGVMIGLGEVGRDDLARILSIAGRRAKPAS